MVTGTILVNNLYAPVLFDSGAAHLFGNPEIASKITNKPNEVEI